MDKKISYWADLGDYDLETSAAMLSSKRYLYVGFMAHQAVEKILKAYYVKTHDKTAPFSHSLSFLAKEAGLYNNLSEPQKDFIDTLEPMNIEARYPTHKDQLLKSLTTEKCTELFEKTQELFEWIKQRL